MKLRNYLLLAGTSLFLGACSTMTTEEAPAVTQTEPEPASIEPPKLEPAKAPEQNILFAFDSHNISSEQTSILDVWAKYLNTVNAEEVAIHGHADAIGEDKYNYELSKKRAEEVLAELSKRLGDTVNIQLYAYGEATPVASNDNESGRQKNRRVEIELKSADPLAQDSGTEQLITTEAENTDIASKK